MKKSIKIWLGAVGILLIALGFVCLLNPVETINSIAWIIGLLFILSGFLLFVVWTKARQFLPEAGLMFFSAFMQVFLGLLFLLNPASLATAISIIFSFWVLFEGASIAIESFDFKKAGYVRWWILTIVGGIAALLGIVGIFNPAIGGTVISTLISIGIIIAGVGYFVKLAGIKKFEKFVNN